MTSMAKILGKEISRKELSDKVIFHFKEVFKKDWEEKDLEGLIADGRLKSNIKSKHQKNFNDHNSKQI